MTSSEYFVRRPVMATLLALAITVFGLMAYRNLPVSDLPNVFYPIINVEAEYPGASALTMASTVAAPLERYFQGLSGLKVMSSKSKPGYTSIELQFELNHDLAAAAQDVQSAINRASSDLPSDLPSVPTYSKVNPADNPIIYLALSSESLTPAQLYVYGAQRVVKALSTIDGVAQVTIWGSKPAVRLELDPSKLAARGLTLVDAASSIKNGSVTLPGGSLEGQVKSVLLQPEGQLMTAAQYDELVLNYRKGAPVKLKDVGRAVDSVEDENLTVRLWERGRGTLTNVVSLGVLREPGMNTVELAKTIREALPGIEQSLPASVLLRLTYDLSVPILESVDDVKSTLFIAFVLVVVVIFGFLGRLRDTMIPALALPLSLFLTFVVMYALGYSLDLLSLMGLTLAVGFLVDDAIVVLENSARHLDAGKTPFRAALEGSREITGTVWSMTLSLAAVFIPLVFMPGLVGRFMREFAVTIVASIICSGLVAVTISPAMCGRLLRSHTQGPSRLEQKADRAVEGIRKIYMRWLDFFLNRSWLGVVVWVVSLLGTIVLLKHLPTTFMPKGDSGCVLGNIKAIHGTSTALMQDYQKQVENILSQDPDIGLAFTVTGMGGSQGTNKGFVFSTLTPRDQRPPISRVVERLDDRLATLPGANTILSPLPVMTLGDSDSGGDSSEYTFVLKSAEADSLFTASQDFFHQVRGLPGFRDVQTSLDLDAPQLEVTVLRDRASALGVTASDVERTLLLAYAGYKITTIKAANDQYKVILQVGRRERANPHDLSQLYVRPTSGNGLVPLSETASWRETVGPLEVRHLDQQNEVKISFNLDEKMPLGTATNRLERLAAETLPPSVVGSFQGEAAEFKKTISSFFLLMVLAVLVMYLVLGVLYESYLHPITVLSSLPVAGFGGLLTLFVFRSELSIYSFIGLFMLMGIVKKNGIMMVDFAVQRLAAGGVTRREAVREACEARFRPIMMTSLAAIVGALPIALGYGADGASRRPLGLAVVGGLIFSQLITLFVNPTIYLGMEWLQEKVLFRFAFFRPPEQISEPAQDQTSTTANS